ncbi:tetraacyldisaccharide 4'-kinase [Shewanella sp. NIFS-20-20]|uniref:tetraacyldisaccharide 4'-kinase n=1 Tax=Shewanella sp. NIFS-20-20 TaxID=2853806 RepID=UPI001C48A740|nr:tetraacyldisaccharide 4'-kinase [Shewanella sp. NIFS-20-20]MBV7315513.1 tetraacyldisaccharide 4'-kinase [Shewanella sp. NIFS-20-20]
MQHWVHQIWYGNHWAKYLLLPFSLLFAVITSLRRRLFSLGLKAQTSLPVPVIVVGNITAGGSGKTPTVLYLIELLRAEGYRPGVISRGYGVSITAPRWVSPTDSASDVGDEPAMLVRRSQVPMVVAPDRIAAAELLLAKADVDVIICDDGLQHYRLARDIEIIVVDGDRRVGNGYLLPAGPLREGPWRLNTTEFVIANGTAAAGEYPMMLINAGLFHLDGQRSAHLDDPAVVAMAAIGNPERFFASLVQQGYQLVRQRAFSDHAPFNETELISLSAGLPLLMTEKDAVKCRDFAQPHWRYLAVNAKLTPEFDSRLLSRLADVVATKKGNSHGV